MTAAITGMGWVTAGGMGFGQKNHGFALRDGKLPAVTRSSVFDKPYPHFGRMDDFSRLGLAAISFALRDAELDKWAQKRHVGIVATTVYGCLHTDIDYFETVMPNGGTMASPTLFSYTLSNCFLGEAAVCFGLSGESYVIYEKSLLGMIGLRTALQDIASGEIATILCGFCDLGPPPELFLQGKPLAGALFFVLEKNPGSNRPNYGALNINRADTVLFNGNEIKDMLQLAQKCLAISPKW